MLRCLLPKAVSSVPLFAGIDSILSNLLFLLNIL